MASQSLTFGRPPSLSSAHIDSSLPHPMSTTASGEVEMTCMFFFVSSMCRVPTYNLASRGLETQVLVSVFKRRARSSFWLPNTKL